MSPNALNEFGAPDVEELKACSRPRCRGERSLCLVRNSNPNIFMIQTARPRQRPHAGER